MTILITGAAGFIGTHLARDLTERGISVRLLDRAPMPTAPAAAAVTCADLRDLRGVVTAAHGVSAIVHLGAITEEASWPRICDHNITGSYNVLEAARRCRVPRVVLASSHHVMGMHAVGTLVTGASPPAPDTFYAVSKITAEALGRFYAAKCAMNVVAVRIGSCKPKPVEPRHRATWLSPRDATDLLHAAATKPLTTPYLSVFATSDNAERWWPRDGWDELGYHPHDSADNAPGACGPLADRWQGGSYAEHPGPEILGRPNAPVKEAER